MLVSFNNSRNSSYFEELQRISPKFFFCLLLQMAELFDRDIKTIGKHIANTGCEEPEFQISYAVRSKKSQTGIAHTHIK